VHDSLLGQCWLQVEENEAGGRHWPRSGLWCERTVCNAGAVPRSGLHLSKAVEVLAIEQFIALDVYPDYYYSEVKSFHGLAAGRRRARLNSLCFARLATSLGIG
jgi:hypothetical protein